MKLTATFAAVIAVLAIAFAPTPKPAQMAPIAVAQFGCQSAAMALINATEAEGIPQEWKGVPDAGPCPEDYTMDAECLALKEDQYETDWANLHNDIRSELSDLADDARQNLDFIEWLNNGCNTQACQDAVCAQVENVKSDFLAGVGALLNELGDSLKALDDSYVDSVQEECCEADYH